MTTELWSPECITQEMHVGQPSNCVQLSRFKLPSKLSNLISIDCTRYTLTVRLASSIYNLHDILNHKKKVYQNREQSSGEQDCIYLYLLIHTLCKPFGFDLIKVTTNFQKHREVVRGT